VINKNEFHIQRVYINGLGKRLNEAVCPAVGGWGGTVILLLILTIFSQSVYCQKPGKSFARKTERKVEQQERYSAKKQKLYTSDKGDTEVVKAEIEPSEKEKAEIKRISALINKYGYTVGMKISKGEVWLGMNVNMALDSWGIPFRVKRSLSNWSEREQWIYSNAYLYFENGSLAEIFKIK
jgi:hypothetical protein